MTYPLFCSISFCHCSGNFIMPSSQNFLSYWAKNSSRCLCSLQGLKYFSLREFCKNQSKWTSKDEISWWIKLQESELPSQAITALAGQLWNMCLVLSWWKIIHFLLTNSECFSSYAAFKLSNWEQYLELIVWFPKRNSQ